VQAGEVGVLRDVETSVTVEDRHLHVRGVARVDDNANIAIVTNALRVM
jgi:hypothetical protein